MLVTFSMIDIMRENADAGEPEGEDEEGEEEEEDYAGDEEVVKEPKEDKTTIKYILINCHLFQKINFAGILITYFNQFAKNGYDAYAESFLSLMLTEDKDQIADNNMTVAMEKATYIDMSNLFIFNQVVMFVDSFLICMAAISLLKYTSMSVCIIDLCFFLTINVSA